MVKPDKTFYRNRSKQTLNQRRHVNIGVIVVSFMCSGGKHGKLIGSYTA